MASELEKNLWQAEGLGMCVQYEVMLLGSVQAPTLQHLDSSSCYDMVSKGCYVGLGRHGKQSLLHWTRQKIVCQ